MKVKFTTSDREFQKQMKSIDKDVNDRLGREAYHYFRGQTPIDQGYARRNTEYKSKRDVKEIIADYPYSERLNTGWSQQAPRGMVKPTIEFIKKRVQEMIGKNNG